MKFTYSLCSNTSIIISRSIRFGSSGSCIVGGIGIGWSSRTLLVVVVIIAVTVIVVVVVSRSCSSSNSISIEHSTRLLTICIRVTICYYIRHY